MGKSLLEGLRRESESFGRDMGVGFQSGRLGVRGGGEGKMKERERTGEGGSAGKWEDGLEGGGCEMGMEINTAPPYTTYQKMVLLFFTIQRRKLGPLDGNSKDKESR